MGTGSRPSQGEQSSADLPCPRMFSMEKYRRPRVCKRARLQPCRKNRIRSDANEGAVIRPVGERHCSLSTAGVPRVSPPLRDLGPPQIRRSERSEEPALSLPKDRCNGQRQTASTLMRLLSRRKLPQQRLQSRGRITRSLNLAVEISKFQAHPRKHLFVRQ